MIVAEQKKKMKRCPVSMQPDIENLLNDLSPEDFSKASKEEKDDFIQDRKSVSYWKDAWRRLRKNTVAMVALVIIILLSVFGDVSVSIRGKKTVYGLFLFPFPTIYGMVGVGLAFIVRRP